MKRVVMVVNTVNIINVIKMHTQKLLKWHVYFIMEKYGKRNQLPFHKIAIPGRFLFQP